jgi:hypothetical protein
MKMISVFLKDKSEFSVVKDEQGWYTVMKGSSPIWNTTDFDRAREYMLFVAESGF